MKQSGAALSALLPLVVLLSHTGLSFARSLSLDDTYWVDNVDKRNSWFSKKSLDEFGPLSNAASAISQQTEGDHSRQLYSCYVETCVPDFIICAKRSRTQRGFSMCKMDHRVCAVECWTKTSKETGA
ncbi:uncharacterized protein [Haliotis cracherodii]|nr:uncharacterized protein LOC124115600 isoform X2 [Haliotis rufescens]